MQTINTYTYSFGGLSPAAQQKARDWWRSTGDTFGWDSEYRDSLKAFTDHWGGIIVREWSVDAGNYSYSCTLDNEIFRGVKLKSIPVDHMPTGFCADYALWGTMREVWKRTGDPKEACDMAIDAFFKAWRDDMESALSDESVDFMLTANGYQFFEDGRIV